MYHDRTVKSNRCRDQGALKGEREVFELRAGVWRRLEANRRRTQRDDIQHAAVRVVGTQFQGATLEFWEPGDEKRPPDPEDALKSAYELVSNNDLYVAVNMVGREDNDKGHPLRFLSTH